MRASGWILVRAILRLGRTRPPDDRSLAVLIHSFDGYKRFWKPVVRFTTENLPFGVPLFFASEETPMTQGPVTPLLTGSGRFGDRMKRAVRHVQKSGFKYVLYLQEDMWIDTPISRSELDNYLELMERHELDALKLADLADAPDATDELERTCTILGDRPVESAVRWFGCRPYAFSHHTTIFRTSFLYEMAAAASLFRRVKPLQQEQFCSEYIKWRTSSNGSDGRYRIATFSGDPLISYVHASEMGMLTEEAVVLLAEKGISNLWEPDQPGEFFPERRRTIK